MQTIHSLQEAEAALIPFLPSRVNRHAYTTEHIRQFMDFAGNPQNKPKAIHIAGTSGKTSTAYYAAALLRQAGKKVGLLTSPHVEGLNERVQMNLVPLPEAEFCSELTAFMALVEQSGIQLTYAEILYGFGFWEFARQHANYIVIEVGLGGLLDATNVIDREDKIAVITDIGMDHVHILGDTLAGITAQKAGIIHLHNAVFCHRQADEVMEVIRKASRQKQADLHIIDQADRTPQHLPLFQRRNFSLALGMVDFALERAGSKSLTPAMVAAASEVHIPARMEIFRHGDKTVILDSAHNAQKLHALMESLDQKFAGQGVAALVAFVATKGRNIHDLIAEIKPHVTHLVATQIPSAAGGHDSRPVSEILAVAQGVPSEGIADYQAAYRALLERPEPVLLITGSIYLLEHLRPFVR
ncbi:MAG TPA: Mur ligase family protein [Candidatus Saccharimonadales bacterium]|nr:Mur ligase family protein [Candidatus Saccharimonadales bacterium]